MRYGIPVLLSLMEGQMQIEGEKGGDVVILKRYLSPKLVIFMILNAAIQRVSNG